MSRAVEEWRGRTDDTPVPPRVQLRVFEAFGGVCQCGCKTKIRSGDPWDVDHELALILGGENRESNLRPILREHHKAKTKADMRAKSKNYRIRARNAGIRKPRTITRWRRFSGEVVVASRER